MFFSIAWIHAWHNSGYIAECELSFTSYWYPRLSNRSTTVQCAGRSLRIPGIIVKTNRIVSYNLRYLNKISTVIVSNPKTKVAMARKKGAKYVPKHKCKTIYEMCCVGVKSCLVTENYKILKSTVSSIIGLFERASKTKINRKTRSSPKNCPDEVWGCYVNNFWITASTHCIYYSEDLVHILEHLSERIGCRYILMLKIDSCIAVQKPSL